MKYRALGRTGVQVSQLCCGTMAFGGDTDEKEAARIYRAAREAGINFFDTADQYSKGRSEEILGGLIQAERDQLVIATKCFNPTGTDVNARGSSRRHVSRAVEASLERLGTDRVEILFLHHYDALTPLEEQMRGVEDLVRAGKVLYPAVSNYAAWQTQAALGIQERALSKSGCVRRLRASVSRMADRKCPSFASFSASAWYADKSLVISSERPTALSRLAPTRPANVAPRHVRTGTPAQRASLAVVCAL